MSKLLEEMTIGRLLAAGEEESQGNECDLVGTAGILVQTFLMIICITSLVSKWIVFLTVCSEKIHTGGKAHMESLLPGYMEVADFCGLWSRPQRPPLRVPEDNH